MAPTREVLIRSLMIVILPLDITIPLILIRDSACTLCAVARANKETSLKVVSFKCNDSSGSSFSGHSNSLSVLQTVSYSGFVGLIL